MWTTFRKPSEDTPTVTWQGADRPLTSACFCQAAVPAGITGPAKLGSWTINNVITKTLTLVHFGFSSVKTESLTMTFLIPTSGERKEEKMKILYGESMWTGDGHIDSTARVCVCFGRLYSHMFSCRIKLAMLLCLKNFGRISLEKRPWSNTWKLFPLWDTSRIKGWRLD